MKSKLLIKLFAVVAVFTLGICALVSTPVNARSASETPSTNTEKTDAVCNNTEIPEEVKKAAGCPGYGNENALPPVVIGILNAVIAISGLVAVIYVIIGGINYMTSQGDGNKLQKAKNTILYALVGMTVAVLAFAIVNFVIVRILDAGETSESSSLYNTDKE